jgi:hypothetical protein
VADVRLHETREQRRLARENVPLRAVAGHAPQCPARVDYDGQVTRVSGPVDGAVGACVTDDLTGR